MSNRHVATLMGWGRFLCLQEDLRVQMARIEKIRPKGNFGIAVEDDDWALVWQRLNFRKWRAHRAFNMVGARTYSFTGDGPLSINLFGVSMPGWVGKSEEEYAADNAVKFHDSYRLKAVRAKKLLTERHGPLGEHLTGLLDIHDHEQAMADAWG